jgi:hypothetical protein
MSKGMGTTAKSSPQIAEARTSCVVLRVIRGAKYMRTGSTMSTWMKGTGAIELGGMVIGGAGVREAGKLTFTRPAVVAG